MQRVLSGIEDESLQVAIVWTAVLRADDESAAIQSRELVPDERVRHYWDAQQALGTKIAPVIGTKMQMAWDVYLAYDGGATWKSGQTPPAPANWLHQKRGEDPQRYMNEVSLEAMLKAALD